MTTNGEPATTPPSPRPWRSAPFRLGAASFAWLLVISALHFWLNGERSSGRLVRMGHMPVLSNLACPLLDEASRDSSPRFVAVKFSSFAEMAESFRAGTIDAAFIIAPLPLVLRSQGVPARIVYIGNRNESTLVARKELRVGRGQVELLRDRTVAVPIRFSGQNLALRRLLAQRQMTAESVRIVEMQPPDMAAAVQNGSLDAYFVGEPFAARALAAGAATVVVNAEDVWPGFFSNLMIVSDELIRKEPGLVRKLVGGAVRSGLWAQAHRREAAAVASRFWGQPADLLLYAMDTPPGRIVFDRPVPRREEVQEIFDAMVAAGLIDASARHVVDDAVDDTFARDVPPSGLTADPRSILAIP